MVKSTSSKSAKAEKSISSRSPPEQRHIKQEEIWEDDCIVDADAVVMSKLSRSLKAEPSANSKDSSPQSEVKNRPVWTLDDEDEINSNSADLTVTGVDEQEYDDNVSRTFVVVKLDPVVLILIKSATGDKNEPVLNIQICDPTGVKRLIVVWGEHSYRVEKFFIANESTTPNPTVYRFPQPAEFTTIGSSLWLENDSSKFLQFVHKNASPSQSSFHGVQEIYSLTCLTPNPRRNELNLSHHVLPTVLEWPSYKYYTNDGDYLKQPKHWYTPPVIAYTDSKHDFASKSPVKAFNPRKY